VYAQFFTGMLEHGVYLPPSRFEALFVSTSHTDQHVDKIVEAAADVFARL
jgi:glutamate-1-semialdehyde 2,1-aminomutase